MPTKTPHVRNGLPNPVWDDASLAHVHQVPDKARRVQVMFDSIVPRYELVNTLTTLGLDGTWRRRLARCLDLPQGARVLDVACGTGQVVRAFRRYRPEVGELWGVDFSGQMVRQAWRLHKEQCTGGRSVSGTRYSQPRACYLQGDAQRLPFADGAFDAVTCVFGVRNFADPQAGLAEMIRVLRPGGMVGILEFSMPRAVILAGLYKVYFRFVLPRLASWLSGDSSGAYRYLQKSVEAFNQDVSLDVCLKQCGFERVAVRSLTFGVVSLYMAYKP